MKIDAEQPAKFIDPATGEPTDATELPAMKDGKQVGTYTINPTTGEVTFTPNKDFVGTPDWNFSTSERCEWYTSNS